ncbi:MAG: radical SAM protein [Anaerovoracaceae bacterium]|jgi:uncharacterized radical SAM superfamily Fe-S cluster-containing enzyme
MAEMEILEKVQSICPVCRKPLTAAYTAREDGVYIEKECPDHGSFRAPVASTVEEYRRWTAREVVNIPPPVALSPGVEGECPLHCGPCERHLQTTCCVLIDITSRCNQHCPYCFARADEGEADEPSLAEIERKYDLLREMGEEECPYNIQLSGGEPTVRDDLPEIVRLAVEKGFRYIQLNTNGRRIAEEEGYAEKLKEAGVSAVFLQFDGMSDEVYLRTRGEPLLEKKKQTVINCRRAGLPVTLVPTVVRDVNLDQIGPMIRYLLDNVDVIKGIHFQPVSYFGRHPREEQRVTMFDVLHAIEEQTDDIHVDDFCPITTGHTLCCFYSTFLKEGDHVVCQLSEETKSVGTSCCCGTETDSRIEIIRRDREFVLNKWDLPGSASDGACCCEGTEPAGAEACCEGTEPAGAEACCCEETEPAGAEACCGGETASTEAEPCCCEETEPAKTESCCEEAAKAASCCDNAASAGRPCCPEAAPSETESCCGGEPDGEEIPDLDEFLRRYKTHLFTLTGMAFMDGSNLDAERLRRCRVVQLTDDDNLVPFCAYNTIWRGER